MIFDYFILFEFSNVILVMTGPFCGTEQIANWWNVEKWGDDSE